jgi:hypothetical protein
MNKHKLKNSECGMQIVKLGADSGQKMPRINS